MSKIRKPRGNRKGEDLYPNWIRKLIVNISQFFEDKVFGVDFQPTMVFIAQMLVFQKGKGLSHLMHSFFLLFFFLFNSQEMRHNLYYSYYLFAVLIN